MKKWMAVVGVLALLGVPESATATEQNRPELNGTAQGAKFILPIVKRDSLLNGLQLIVIEQSGTGAVSIRLRINSGAMFDLTGKGGLADLTAGMLLRGGGGLNARAVGETVEQSGLNVSVAVGWDATDIVVSGPADALESIFDLLGRLIVTPTFDQKELEALKTSRVSAVKEEAGDDAEAVRRKSLEMTYGSHPYGRPSRGTPDSLSQVTRNDLLFFYNRYYIANNSELMITGDATAEVVTRLARAKLGSWKKGDKVPATFKPPEPGSSKRAAILDRPQSQLAQASIAQVGISRRAGDYLAALVMGEILRQKVSRLAAGGQGVVIQTSIEPRTLAGPILIHVKSAPDSVAGLIDGVLAEIANLQTAQPPIEQVELAKSQVIGQFAEQLKSPESSAEVILDIELYGLGRDYIVNFADRVNAVTPADVMKAAQTYLRPQSAVIVVAGPAGQLETALKKHGTTSVLR